MTEEELQSIAAAYSCPRYWPIVYGDVSKLIAEIRRLRAAHQDLWQLVDREIDRIYCEAKRIEQ